MVEQHTSFGRTALAAAALMVALSGLTAACASSTAPGAAPSTPGTTAHHRQRHHRRRHHAKRHHSLAHRAIDAGVSRSDLPRPALTPGVVLAVGRAQVCVSGYASATRDVPTSESDAVYLRYHVAHVPYAHEVDHLISLELGGSNAIANLWPEPYSGRWGARTKDVLENRLHDLVCAGQLALRTAQRLEATNWVAAYRRFLGSPR
jgi:5-methylcytosine-specific restriction endonuclease McrA